MKIHFDIDCTPQEARAMLGLPDVSSLHDIYLDRMKTFLNQGVTPDMAGDRLKSWGSLGTAGVALFQQFLGQMGAMASGEDKSGGSRKR